MTGFMQTTFFFGDMAAVCYGFSSCSGRSRFPGLAGVRAYIYRAIKCE